MRKHAYLALLCAVVIIGLLIPPVAAVESAPGEPLYRGFDAAQNRPDIDGDTIVWEDDRYGDMDIYLGTVGEFQASLGYTGERITDNPASQEKPSISGDYIVWQDDRHDNWDIYLYERSTGIETQLTTDSGKQWMPAIRGNYVAWYDDSSGRNNTVLYDIAEGDVKDVIDCDAHTLIPDGGTTEFKPALSEKYIAWVEESDRRVHYYDIAAGQILGPVSTSDAEQSWPSLYGSLIAWEDYRHANPDIYMTDLDNPFAEEKRITLDTTDQVSPAISGSIIVWEDKRVPARSIFMYDLSTGEEMSVLLAEDTSDEHLYPAVSENTIVWQRGGSPNSNLYLFIYEPGAPVEPVLDHITVTPSTATLAIDETEQFIATCYDQNGDEMIDIEIKWICSDEDVGTIDESSGFFTAKAAGTATVTASADGIAGTATVTVTDDAPVLDTIEVEPDGITLAIDETTQFEATALDQFGNEMTGVEFEWTCSDETVGTIDDTGLFTAKAAGTATITASADGKSGEATVTVTDEEPVARSITVTPSNPTLATDATEQFEATVRDQFDNEMTGVAVTWSCSDEAVGEIDDAGLFTALTAGMATITASAEGISGTATVTVTAKDPVGPEEPVLTGITLTPPRATLDIEDVQKFMVMGYDQNGNVMPAGEIDWACSGEAVGTIDGNGYFTAKTEGTATVTAMAGSCSAESIITVCAEGPLLAKIAVVPSATTLEIDDTLEFCAVAFDRFGNIVEDAEITWECSDPCVGIIDECGVFTALDGGTATITACGDGAEGTATVAVNCGDPVLSRIVITPAAITLSKGDSVTFTAAALDQDGCEMPGVTIDWCCSNEAVGTIDSCSGAFTALDCGTATVTASADGICVTADIEVTDESSGVVVSPSAIILDPEDEWQFTVYDLQDNAGSIVAWSCADPGVGEITDTGLFTACGEGSTSITATAGDASGTAMVTVRSTAPELARIVVCPSDLYIPAGNCLTLTARGFDQYGLPMDVEVDWESSDPSVGTIDKCSGTFTALAEGEVFLTASADGVCGSACVTVEPPLPVPDCIDVVPSTAALVPGGTQEFTATVFDQCENVMDWVRVRWSCSDADIGTIDRAGLFAAFAEGSTDVKACAGGVEGAAAVTITAAPTTDPTPDPGNNDGPTGSAQSDGGGWSPPTLCAAICEDLKSGETFVFSDVSVSSVGSVAITAANNIPKMLVVVKETGCPNQAEPPGGAYEYVEIALSWVKPDDIDNGTVTFAIPARWLEEHDMLPEDVRLMRYVDGGWQILDTEVIGEENGKYLFQATTPGFSTFVIAAAPVNVTITAEANATAEETNATATVTEEVTTEPTTAAPATTPAAPLVYAPLLAPLAFLLWRRRKN